MRVRPPGFTLLEMMLAIFLAVLVLSLAVPSVAGLLAEGRRRQSFDAFDKLVNEASARSIATRRTQYLVWERDRVFLAVDPTEPADKDDAAEGSAPEFPLGRKETLTIHFPAALEEVTDPVWAFWPTGTCEPAVVTFSGQSAAWTAAYDPLTVRPDFTQRR